MLINAIANGMTQGALPLIGCCYAAKNYARIAAVCVVTGIGLYTRGIQFELLNADPSYTSQKIMTNSLLHTLARYAAARRLEVDCRNRTVAIL